MNDTLTDNSLVSKYMNMLAPLNFEVKLAILSKLSENLQSEFAAGPKQKSDDQLLDELYGAWSDMDESILDDIMSSRTISDKEINLDE